MLRASMSLLTLLYMPPILMDFEKMMPCSILAGAVVAGKSVTLGRALSIFLPHISILCMLYTYSYTYIIHIFWQYNVLDDYTF